MKTFYFIRHGKTEYNIQGRFIGKTDMPLSNEGKTHIASLWHKRNENIIKDVIFTSPMQRCLNTAEIIFPKEHYNIIENIREINFGIFEGHTYDDLKDSKPYALFRKNPVTYKIPEGESGMEFSKRVLSGFKEIISIMESNNMENAAVVCHGGVIMALFAHLCPLSSDIYYYHVDNGCGYKAEYENKQLNIIEKL